jgi:hypothetical protein
MIIFNLKRCPYLESREENDSCKGVSYSFREGGDAYLVSSPEISHIVTRIESLSKISSSPQQVVEAQHCAALC